MEILLTDEELNQIASELEVGMDCYFQTQTREIYTYLSETSYECCDIDESWKKEHKEWVKKNKKSYIVFEPMSSSEKFSVMKNFIIDIISEETIQEKLFIILDQRKPFSNFKAFVESSKYRQNWFDYKTQKYIEYVKEELEAHNL